jgi:hypothetical protein
MDMGTIYRALKEGKYASKEAVAEDFHLMIKNCETYNPSGHPARAKAVKLEDLFVEQWDLHFADGPTVSASVTTRSPNCEPAKSQPISDHHASALDEVLLIPPRKKPPRVIQSEDESSSDDARPGRLGQERKKESAVIAASASPSSTAVEHNEHNVDARWVQSSLYPRKRTRLVARKY